MGRSNSPSTLCESCKMRPRGASGKLSKCLECLKSLVERDRRMRAERVALRGDNLIRAKLKATKAEGLSNISGASTPERSNAPRRGVSNSHMISENLER